MSKKLVVVVMSLEGLSRMISVLYSPVNEGNFPLNYTGVGFSFERAFEAHLSMESC